MPKKVSEGERRFRAMVAVAEGIDAHNAGVGAREAERQKLLDGELGDAYRAFIKVFCENATLYPKGGTPVGIEVAESPEIIKKIAEALEELEVPMTRFVSTRNGGRGICSSMMGRLVLSRDDHMVVRERSDKTHTISMRVENLLEILRACDVELPTNLKKLENFKPESRVR